MPFDFAGWNEALEKHLERGAGEMSERRCGNCAWWEDRDEVKFVDGEWKQRAINGQLMTYIGPGRCMRDPVIVPKEPNDWCRHHATTRGWDNDLVKSGIEAEHGMLAELCEESDLLRARCREAAQLLRDPRQCLGNEKPDEWRTWKMWRDAWLEGADDEV